MLTSFETTTIMGVTLWLLLFAMTVTGVVPKTVPRNRCACRKKALVNECTNPALNNCDENATCQDLPDGFSCTCNAGFTGEGTTCTPELCNGVPCDAGENRTCFLDSICACIPGFHDDLVAGTCVETCDDYAPPFIVYPETGFACTPVLATATPVFFSDCLTLCANNANCISGTYNSDSDTCFIYECDPLMGAVTFFNTSAGASNTYFALSCA